MKKLVIIAYWVSATLLTAVLLCSLKYRFIEAMFLATLFLPGALAAKFFYPKICFKDISKGLMNACFISLGIFIAETNLFLIGHYWVTLVRGGYGSIYEIPEIPDILINPVFIAAILSILAIGSSFIELWIDKSIPSKPKPVSFFSARRTVTLEMDEILYIESNDSITTVVASDGTRYKNKTSISQWESIFGPKFIRIHRSYLVNRSAVSAIGNDIIFIGESQLPVSKKYKDSVLDVFQNTKSSAESRPDVG